MSKKEIRVCMLSTVVNCADDIYRYLHLDKNGLDFYFTWDETAPDYLIGTEQIYTKYHIWDKFVRLYDIAKVHIFRSLECTVGDLNIFDYAICFDKNLKCDDRTGRSPARLFFQDTIFEKKNQLENKTDAAAKELLNKSGYCDFIYSNSLGNSLREKLFYKVSEYKRVDSLGNFLNNCNNGALHKQTEFEEGDWASIIQDTIKVKSKYKFSIACENAYYAGYTSEKVFSALAAHTIPIYWGNPLIGQDVNERAIINCHKYDSLDQVLNRIKEIDLNDELWCQMVSEPWLTKEQEIEEEKDIREYRDFVAHIFMQPVEKANRKGYGFHPERYRKWFFKEQADIVKYRCYHEIELMWIKMMQHGGCIGKYFRQRNYKKIVIYGLGELGILLYESLYKEHLHVLYGIDQGEPEHKEGLVCYKLNEIWEKEEPDVIVVTVPHLFIQIKKELINFYSCSIVSLMNILE